MIRRFGLLVVSLVALWGAGLAIASVAWVRQFQTHLVLISVASGLCALPAFTTILWLSWSVNRTPAHQFQAVFGSMAVRIFFILGTAILLAFLHPYFQLHIRPFLLWISFYYLGTLFLEIGVLIGTNLIPLTVVPVSNTPPQDEIKIRATELSSDNEKGNDVTHPIEQGGTS
ncbi:MAG: hypothetical protein ACFCD0_12095 [Gemmataceae bacterium]